jgi:chemotaxis protein MotB
VTEAAAPLQTAAVDPDPTNTAAQQALAEKLHHDEAVRHEADALAAVQQRLTDALQQQGLGDSVRFRQEARGLVVSVVADSVLFDLGSAELRPDGRRVLDAVSGVLASLPNQVAIEGHTDDRPIRGPGGRYATNWELSTARATSVLHYLVAAHSLTAGRLSAAGYADQRPLVPNDTDEHRARNRRVEVVVLNAAT